MFAERGQGEILELTNEAQDDVNWLFTTSSFTLNDMELTSNSNNQVTFDLALPGIGFPSSVYYTLLKKIEPLNSKIVCS